MCPANAGSDAKQRTAFVADDDEIARALLQSILTTIDLNVVGEATDGKQALLEIKRLLPDVVCLDIDMPMMSGLDVLTQLRNGNEQTHKQMIVLLVTATPTAQHVREAIAARADGVIAKPFNQDKIASEISRVAARKMRKN